MNLRSELCPPPNDPDRTARISALIARIEAEPSEEEVAAAMTELQSLAGSTVTLDDIQNYWRGMSLDEFVENISRQRPQRVLDVTREELIEIARRMRPDGGYPDHQGYAEVFDMQVSMPSASMMMYHPPDHVTISVPISEYDPTPEVLVDWALAYRVIRL